MKTCAYCGIELNRKTKGRTKEHIIPNGLLRLYPEQKITFTKEKAFLDNYGQAIKDVCANCNNGWLSGLDNYGIKLIEKNFTQDFKPNDTYKISFDYIKLSRWLLKIAFNQTRMEKKNTHWFNENIDYISGKQQNLQSKISIFCGLNVDMNPLGEKTQLYMPLSISSELRFYPTGTFKYSSIIKGKLEADKQFIIPNIEKNFLIRFGSIRFLLILWKKDNIEKSLKFERLIEDLFPYTKIQNSEEVILSKVNDEFTGKYPSIVHGTVGMTIWDDFIDSLIPSLELCQNTWKKHYDSLSDDEKKLRGDLFLSIYNKRNQRKENMKL